MFYEQAINGVGASGILHGSQVHAPQSTSQQQTQLQTAHSHHQLANGLYFGYHPQASQFQKQQTQPQNQAFNFPLQNRQNSQDFLNSSQNEKSWLNSSLNEKNWLNNSLNLPTEQRYA